ncbi:MAG: DUF2306 domain-containing protein [Actinomycetota bacterium]|nr:DUF2306 domain-containing protein [Actinomycetota bacterium]
MAATTLSPPAPTRSRADWLVPAGLIVLSLVPAAAGSVRVAELAGAAEATAENARFFDAPIPVVAHVLAVVPYSILGALQFSPRLRRRGGRWHRRAGRALVPLGLVVAVSGLWMTFFYDLPRYDGELFGLLSTMRIAVGLGMVGAILAGVSALRDRDRSGHGAWMTRAYALAMGAGTQVLTGAGLFIFTDDPDPLPRAISMGAGWAINLAVAERVIRRRPTAPAAAVA